MRYRRLGRSGLAVSVAGLGTNNFGSRLDLEQSRAVTHAALDAGITLFDTADAYRDSEVRLGEILRGHRDDVIIATKFGGNVRNSAQTNGQDWGARGSRRYLKKAAEASLRRLQTDWIDLYQLHAPDWKTPMDETLGALDDLVHEGKVRYIGSSNLKGWQVTEAEWIARSRGFERFISAQNCYNWIEREIEQDLIPALTQYEIGLLPYSPLASGKLTGKYRRGEAVPENSRLHAWGQEATLTERVFDVVEKLEAFADERGISLLEIAVGGLAAQPAVASVIAGATTPEQVTANVKAASWEPTAEETAALNAHTELSSSPA